VASAFFFFGEQRFIPEVYFELQSEFSGHLEGDVWISSESVSFFDFVLEISQTSRFSALRRDFDVQADAVENFV
jgi:hypothetical protein